MLVRTYHSNTSLEILTGAIAAGECFRSSERYIPPCLAFNKTLYREMFVLCFVIVFLHLIAGQIANSLTSQRLVNVARWRQPNKRIVL